MRRGGIGSAISYVKYMINNTDAERRRALPQYLKREDWETFVDSEGSLDAQLTRRVGKAARASLKSPHTSSRKGQARVADELVSLRISIYFSSSMYYVMPTFLPNIFSNNNILKGRSPGVRSLSRHITRRMALLQVTMW